jgi:RNA polymerase sigma-70 factor (ECF subfamily)
VVGRPLPETELVARAKAGDATAYEEIVRAHQAIAFRTAYLITGNEADAQRRRRTGS